MKLKELMDEIMDLAYRIDDYAESLSEEEERVMIADAGVYLRILHQLIEKSTPEILDQIQI